MLKEERARKLGFTYGEDGSLITLCYKCHTPLLDDSGGRYGVCSSCRLVMDALLAAAAPCNNQHCLICQGTRCPLAWYRSLRFRSVEWGPGKYVAWACIYSLRDDGSLEVVESTIPTWQLRSPAYRDLVVLDRWEVSLMSGSGASNTP